MERKVGTTYADDVEVGVVLERFPSGLSERLALLLGSAQAGSRSEERVSSEIEVPR